MNLDAISMRIHIWLDAAGKCPKLIHEGQSVPSVAVMHSTKKSNQGFAGETAHVIIP